MIFCHRLLFTFCSFLRVSCVCSSISLLCFLCPSCCIPSPHCVLCSLLISYPSPFVAFSSPLVRPGFKYQSIDSFEKRRPIAKGMAHGLRPRCRSLLHSRCFFYKQSRWCFLMDFSQHSHHHGHRISRYRHAGSFAAEASS